MAIKSKEFVKALELLKLATKVINSMPNKRVESDKYTNSYVLVSEIENLIRRNE